MSLEGMHGSVKVPDSKAGFWKQMAAYFGQTVLVSVAYMDLATGEPIFRAAGSSNAVGFEVQILTAVEWTTVKFSMQARQRVDRSDGPARRSR